MKQLTKKKTLLLQKKQTINTLKQKELGIQASKISTLLRMRKAEIAIQYDFGLLFQILKEKRSFSVSVAFLFYIGRVRK